MQMLEQENAGIIIGAIVSKQKGADLNIQKRYARVFGNQKV